MHAEERRQARVPLQVRVPGRRDEALRRAALARARACGGAAWLLRRYLGLSTPRARMTPIFDPANSSTVRFWNSKGQCAFCAEERPRERCIFPGAGIKFKRKCAGSLLCAA